MLLWYCLSKYDEDPGFHDVESLPPLANHDLTNGSGSKSSIGGPLSFRNIKFAICGGFRLGQAPNLGLG